ncbi:PstS family phosphate ABC transporter substrate-binding protein [Aerosakkonema sp. BLCC-F183]|uniref:PstS family phosphate ABC transporter substrate-binding protein n=1 Tax=Aerosakkonema sp. BLCC-F183 TaxID=3342834 RepID=UPI0035B9FBBD
MQRSSYSILIILTLLCYGCSSSDKPSATIAPKSVPTNPGVQDPPSQNKPSEEKPFTAKPEATAQLVNARTNKNSSGVRLPEIDPLEVEGNLTVAGSSSVFPLSKVIYERFIAYGYAGTIDLYSIGTGAGFNLFCKEKKSDITNASRPIEEEEIKACTANGRTPVEFRIGSDAVAVVINRKNRFVNNVTTKELATLFTAEKWSDVNPKWPNERIQRILPSSTASRFSLFVEKVLNGKDKLLLNSPYSQFTDDDDYIIQSVVANPYAITFLPYSYYQHNADTLKAISIEGVEPKAETVENGEYLLTRPLLMYSDVNTIRKKPQVRAFINFYLTYINQEITKVGYFPLSQNELDNSKMKLLKATEPEKAD